MRQWVRDLVADGEEPALRSWEKVVCVMERMNIW